MAQFKVVIDYLLPNQCNSGYANAPPLYVVRTLPVLSTALLFSAIMLATDSVVTQTLNTLKCMRCYVCSNVCGH